MFLELASGAFIVGDYIYHRYIEDQPPPTPPAHRIEIPRTDAGSPYPILYGRTRVKSPMLAWASIPSVITGIAASAPNAQYVYCIDLFFVLGIPFDNPGSCKLRNMWVGELPLASGPPGYTGLDGNGGFGSHDNCPVGQTVSGNLPGDSGAIGGLVEFLNGNPSQAFYDGFGTAQNNVADVMVFDGVVPFNVPSFRGVLSAFLFQSGGESNRWYIGSSPTLPSYSFEVDSIPASPIGPAATVATLDGDVTVDNGDANPIDVLYDILTGVKGKLGLPAGRVDLVSFTTAADTIASEYNGFSRCWDQGLAARDMIDEILKQVDGVLYEDPRDGLIKIRLVRADYDPSTLLVVSPSTGGVELQGLALGGWTGITNKIRINFTDRGDDYRANSATDHNLADAFGQDNEVRETSLSMPGVCNYPQAVQLAARELAARSRPMLKCRAICDRTFRNVVPGDVVNLTWPEYGISNIICRVAAVGRGTLDNNRVALDLIQDFFYVWRLRPPARPPVAGFRPPLAP